jgi:hypothetical protein
MFAILLRDGIHLVACFRHVPQFQPAQGGLHMEVLRMWQRILRHRRSLAPRIQDAKPGYQRGQEEFHAKGATEVVGSVKPGVPGLGHLDLNRLARVKQSGADLAIRAVCFSVPP